MCFVSHLKRGLLLKEIIAPHLPGSTFCPSGVDPFQKGTHKQKSKQEVYNVVSVLKNGMLVSSLKRKYTHTEIT